MTTPTLCRYEITTEKGGWLASIVIDCDGYFSAVSDYGTYAYSWQRFGPMGFRHFLADTTGEYVTGKAGSIDEPCADLFAERVWPRFTAMLRAELAAEPTPLDSAVAIVQGGLVLVDAIVRSGPLFLGVSRKNDHTNMGCPGGKVQPGESLEEACLRELFEETGYVGRIIRQVHSGPSTHGTCTAFLVEIVGVGQRAPGETGRVAWVPAEELYAGSFGRFYREALREFDVPPVVYVPRSVAFRRWLADVARSIGPQRSAADFDPEWKKTCRAAFRAGYRAAMRAERKQHPDAIIEHYDSRGDGHCIPAFPTVNTFLTPGGEPPAGWPKAKQETR